MRALVLLLLLAACAAPPPSKANPNARPLAGTRWVLIQEANIRAPTTILYVIPPNMPFTPEQYTGFMEASYATLPNKRIVRIDESYHFIMIDQFERFMSEVNAFLATN